VLQPGATFILEYANKQNWKAIIRYLLRRQSWSPFTLEPVEFVELNFDFHPRSVRSWLSGANFDVQRQLTVSHYRSATLKRLVPLRLLVWLDSLAQYSGDWWQLTPSVFVKSKAVGDTSIATPGELFRCPECGQFPLERESDHLTCTACGQRYAIRDGIFDFREPLGK
jgi:hypothetical protein